LITALTLALGLGACSKNRAPKKTNAPNAIIAHDPGTAVVDPELVDMKGDLANAFVPADQASDLLVRLQLSADTIPDAPRPAINLMLVVDTSGSMEGDAIVDAREAAAALVDQLEPGDRFGLVVFHSKAEVLVPSTHVDEDSLPDIRERVKRMQARGTTDLAGGLSNALQQIGGAMSADGINRVVLLSDGVPNDPAPIQSLAQNARNMGVSITALGLGLEYDETLLSQVAQTSGGSFHFVESSTEVAAVFRDEVLRLERIAAANTSLTLRPGPGVSVVEIIGHPFSVAGDRSTMIHPGDIAEGESRDVFVRLQVSAHVDRAPVELLDAVFGFDDTVNGSGRHERDLYVSARATSDQTQLERGRAHAIELSSERARAAAAIVDAIALSRSGRLGEARNVLDQAETRARTLADEHEDEDLRVQAEEMVELRAALPAVAQTPPPAIAAGGAGNGPTGGQDAVAPVPMAPEPFPESAPSTVRRSHGKAMRRLQGH
jgi:Ca-activated chloride channel family protein